MSRVRISTTVDGDQLERARALLSAPDSKLIDRALSALVDQLEVERELRALAAHPYEDDPDLSWEVPLGPNLVYDGDVPAEVMRLAAARRKARR
jgi:hypothetical protein